MPHAPHSSPSAGPPPTRAVERAWIALFLLVLIAPSVALLALPAGSADDAAEFRRLAELPGAPTTWTQLRAYPKAAERWFDDHFGLRKDMLRAYNLAQVRLFAHSPTEQVALGRSGWIFSRIDGALEDYAGQRPYTPRELSAWERFLRERREWLAQRGCNFLFLVSPEKSSIYPEFLPDEVGPPGARRLDLLKARFGPQDPVRIVDLTDTALEAKAEDRPGDTSYYPLGTHWTPRGAYAGYRRIVAELSGTLGPVDALPREAFDVRPASDSGDSWATRLYLRDVLRQSYDTWTLRAPRARAVDAADGTAATYERGDAPELPRALVYHDSFLLDIRPWLAEHFSRVDYRWGLTFSAADFEALKPDVVLYAINEFSLRSMQPFATREEAGARRARRFESSKDVIWRWRPERGLADWTVQTGAELALDAQGFRLLRGSGAGQLLFPEIELPLDADSGLRLVLEPGTTEEALLLLTSRWSPAHTATQALPLRVQPGALDTLDFELPGAERPGRLGLVLRSREAVHLREVELRRLGNE